MGMVPGRGRRARRGGGRRAPFVVHQGILKAVRRAAELLSSRGDCARTMDQLIESIGRAADVTRVYIYRAYGQGISHFEAILEWTADGYEPLVLSEPFQTLHVDGFGLRPLLNRLRSSALELLPQQIPAPIGPALAERGSKSIIIVPILTDDDLWGFIGLEESRYVRHWDDISCGGLVAIASMIGSAIDRAAMDKLVEEREAYLQALVASVQDAVLVVDQEGLVTQWLPGAAQLFGWREGDVLGKHWRLLLKKPVDEPATLVAACSAPMAVTAVRCNGRPFQAELTSGRWLHADEPRWTLVVRDVTARVESERRLRQMHKAKALGNLASGIAHDFNNMLQPILTLSEMMVESFPPGDANRPRLEAITDAAMGARQLVEKILLFGREDGLGEREIVKAGDFLRDVLEFVRPVVPATVALELVAEHACFVNVDKVQLQAAIINLITNSVDALAGGTGFVRLTLRKLPGNEKPAGLDATATDLVAIDVKDNGCGIDDQSIGRVFDPFFTTKEVGEGTGLGLPMAYSAVTSMGGTITVRSLPGFGTTFTIVLPEALEPVHGPSGAVAAS